ncbi:MAG TPA: metallophosphoesterase [Phycisphaerae bacterium]|nr:metallophosphoesterase [Phycisphaerae bacterium]
MRVLITADLHYDIQRSRDPCRRLAEEVCRLGGDALVLVGDTGAADLGPFRECLSLFAGFAGRKLLVPGNHCLWCSSDAGSMERYEHLLPAAAAEEGFHVLDHGPVVLEKVGLVGSIGWYDYSLKDESLGIPEAFYRAKIAPGAAHCTGEQAELIEAHRGRLTDRQLAIVSRWMDGRYVRLGMSDEEFVALLTDKLARQLEELSPRVDRIVAFVHHLPFRDLVPQGRPDRFAFAAAFMGSERIGRALLACGKVAYVYCGHSHSPGRRQIGHLTVVNVGSTYTRKHLEILEL